MTTLHSKSTEIDYNELATLKHLALRGGIDGTTTIAGRDIADELSVSIQTVSRRLRHLESSGLLSRKMVSNGQEITINDAGEAVLRREFEQYHRIFETLSPLVMRGVVTDGVGEAKHYIDLPGYKRQFRERLGYEPYAGTLNVALDAASVEKRSRLEATSGIDIDEWADDDRTYGAATCYPARLEAGPTRAFEPVHILVPDRTHHEEDNIEVIGPVKFRNELELTDQDEVTIYVRE